MIAALAAIVLVGVLLVWLLLLTDAFGGLGPVMPWMIGGVIATAILTGVLMWLAFFSSRRGFDEPYDVNKPNGGRRQRDR